MGERELDRSGAERDTMPVADLADPAGALDDLRRRGRVVEPAPGPRIGEQPAVHDPADQHRDAALLAGRQQLVEGVLFEERVAPGEEDGVHVGLADEAREHLRLVHAGPDSPDQALLAEPGKGRVRPVERGLPVVVRVVDQCDVDPLEPEPLQALLDRPPDAVGRIVEDDALGPGDDVEGVVAAVEALVIALVVGADCIRPAGRAGRPSSTGRRRPGCSSAQCRTDPPLRRSVAVEGSRVEVADAEVPGVTDRGPRVVVGDRREDSADRRATEPEPRDRQSRSARAGRAQRGSKAMAPSCG